MQIRKIIPFKAIPKLAHHGRIFTLDKGSGEGMVLWTVKGALQITKKTDNRLRDP
jgi:hypothetical protein